MSKRIFSTGGLSFTATALNSAIAAGSTYMALKGGASTQIIQVTEVYIAGMAATSTLGGFQLVHASTIETGSPTALSAQNSDGPMVVTATALASVAVPFVVAATTQPTPSNSGTLPKLNVGLNLFGGIVRWVAYPGEEWTQVGNVANGGESVLINNSGANGATGSANAHIVYEPL